MPPRQGHSQFMTPVSSLKAPSWEASDSREEGSVRGEGSEVGVGESEEGGGRGDGLGCWRREEARDSSVGRGVSSVGEEGWGTATGLSLLAAFYYFWPMVWTNKVAPQQTDCSYYNNILPLSPDPIVQRYFSSFVTSELVAR